MAKLLIDSDADNAADMFLLQLEAVERLIVPLQEIIVQWRSGKMKAGEAVNKAVNLGRSHQERGFCIFMVAQAIEHTVIQLQFEKLGVQMANAEEKMKNAIVLGDKEYE